MHPTSSGVTISSILSALSYALDLTEGQPMGHSVRSCVLGMRIGQEAGLSPAALSDLFYALLMKDAGCSSNASRMNQIVGRDEIGAKRAAKLTDWTRVRRDSLQYALEHIRPGAPFLARVQGLAAAAIHNKRNSKELISIRCERGSAIARRLGLSEATAQAIHSLDEHWNGAGHPEGLRGEEIPRLARILNLAQTIEVFFRERGAGAALHVIRSRSGRWFDPELVRAAESLAQRGELWTDLEGAVSMETALRMAPEERRSMVTGEVLDNVCFAFADVIDAKSPFTYRHSNGVADAAVGIARTLGLPAATISFLRRAALLHDIGKLSVPNSILEKPDRLDAAEWTVVKEHPRYTWEILRRVPGFEVLSDVAAAHHEKLDGSGYFRGYGAAQLSLEARILTVADIFDALAAKRPYRDAMPLEKVFPILLQDAPRALDMECVQALIQAKLTEPSNSLGRLHQAITEEPPAGMQGLAERPPGGGNASRA